jgi:TRAP-type C4-dicarboxylate transport system permease small subunit
MSAIKAGKPLFLNLLAMLACLGLLTFIGTNYFTRVSYDLFGLAFEMTLLGFPLLISALLAGLSVFFKMRERVLNARQENLRAERHREKAEVTAEASSERVKALEAKVQTLEKALEQALAQKS